MIAVLERKVNGYKDQDSYSNVWWRIIHTKIRVYYNKLRITTECRGNFKRKTLITNNMIKNYSIKLLKLLVVFILTNLFVFLTFQIAYTFGNGFEIMTEDARYTSVFISCIIYVGILGVLFLYNDKKPLEEPMLLKTL